MCVYEESARRRARATKEHFRTEWAHNGERSRVESCWYWACKCGATEAASTKREAQREWIHHLQWERARPVREHGETAAKVVLDTIARHAEELREIEESHINPLFRGAELHVADMSFVVSGSSHIDAFIGDLSGPLSMEDARKLANWLLAVVGRGESE